MRAEGCSPATPACPCRCRPNASLPSTTRVCPAPVSPHLPMLAHLTDCSRRRKSKKKMKLSWQRKSCWSGCACSWPREAARPPLQRPRGRPTPPCSPPLTWLESLRSSARVSCCSSAGARGRGGRWGGAALAPDGTAPPSRAPSPPLSPCRPGATHHLHVRRGNIRQRWDPRLSLPR